MRFGPLPIEQALGCILAHSVSIEGGRLRKGLQLEAEHIDHLRRAGLTEITVAALEAGDVEENDAARLLGDALLANTAGLRVTKAATGRVNLIATRAGVAMLDLDRLTALNEVNPMISFASVPAYHQLHTGGMLGTVKIISYAVPERDLERACAHAQGALTLAGPLGQTVSLIITQIEHGADETKAIAATKARLDALGSPLIEVLTCAHEKGALINAVHAAKGEVILILTGSATSDPNDVAPAALIGAGGTLIRFGMPVDPGNLLFLARLHEKPVIGLPGCARSPALNGADKVLSRVLCGVPVTSEDIAGMGVGGLLKEIPTRPRPRQA
ncbi:molybdopterin-binding protein [Planktotalea sp.]|uniref:molybdopterin-binding protein n=1 Tax=Planktotalea sp. TaxID=2029877 RepID=UPI003D6B40C0